MIEVQNVSDHALELPVGILSPAERQKVDLDDTIEAFLSAGLLVQIGEDKEKGKSK
jgi:hypothetical protein